ncbi:MAG: hypothetical protein ACJ74G_17255 [Blastocatellia bacterium]
MRFSSLRRVVSGAALSLMIGVLLSGAALAQDRNYQDDRYRNDSRYGQNGSWSRDRVRDYALKLGYHTGYSEVRDNMQNGGRRSIRDIAGYRNDTNGYLVVMGYRDDYRSAYRRGFELAYEDFTHNRERRYTRTDVERALGGRLKDVYNDDRYDQDDWYNGRRDDRGRDWRDNNRDNNRNGRYDRNEITRLAQEAGYRDGLRQGQDDASRRRGSSYDRDSRYRDAQSGWRSEYGDRDTYRQAYREGFRRGYEEGYRSRR